MISNQLLPKFVEENPNSYDIGRAMAQYEKEFIDFKFLGLFPSDIYESNVNCLHEIDFNHYFSNNISCVGVIFNYDNHKESESYWIPVFVDLLNLNIRYSVARDKLIGAAGEIINKVALYAKNHNFKLNINVDIDDETNIHDASNACMFIFQNLKSFAGPYSKK
jgi:hypothetical protein